MQNFFNIMKHFKIQPILVILATLMLLHHTINAQQPFSRYHVQSRGDLTEGCRHLMLEVDASGFFFDAEYATPAAKGFTATGVSLTPTLLFGVNERAQLRVGFQAQMLAGMDSLQHLRPILTLIYQPSRWLSLTAGTLQGWHRSRMGHALLDPSAPLLHPNEEGLQIMTRTRHWRSDTWLDWYHYLKPWTPDQERFTMGSMHEAILYRRQGFQVGVPLLFLANHRGGEVKTIDTNTVTTFNESVGLEVRYRWQNSLNARSNDLTLNMPLLFYHLENTELDHGGWAFHPTLAYQTTLINKNELSGLDLLCRAGYWHGNHFFSTHGSPLFWSINPYTALHMPPSAATPDADVRNLLTATVSLGHQFKNLHCGLQVDAIHDFDMAKTDLTFSFFLRFDESFLLHTE